MIVTVDSTLAFDREEVDTDFFHALRSALTWENPEWRRANSSGRNTRRIPSRLCYLHCTPRRAHLPRGAVRMFSRLAKRHGVALEWRPEVVTFPGNGCELDDLNIHLRPYQIDAVVQMHEQVQGFVVLPCGGGKTTLGATAMIMLGEPGIVCVHTEDLAGQWAETIERIYFEAPRIVGAGNARNFSPLAPGEIAVCLIQTLSRSLSKALPLLSSAGVLIIDECHHIAAASFQKVVSRCPARYRWGLTATPERPDGLDFMLDLHLGGVLLQRTPEELVADNYLMTPEVYPVTTGWNPSASDYDANGRLIYAKAVTKACKDAGRTSLVLDLIREANMAGRTTMVLVPRVGYAKALAARLQAEGIAATCVTGQSNRHARKHRLESVRKGDSSVIIATQLADEGLDLPNLDCLILAAGGRAAGRAIQRVGRIMRISDNKRNPIIFDLVDGGAFKSQWRSRATAYTQHLGVHTGAPVTPEQAFSVLRA